MRLWNTAKNTRIHVDSRQQAERIARKLCRRGLAKPSDFLLLTDDGRGGPLFAEGGR